MKLQLLVIILALTSGIVIAAQYQSDKMISVTIASPQVITETNLNYAMDNIDSRLGLFNTNGITTNLCLGGITSVVTIARGVITSIANSGPQGLTTNVSILEFFSRTGSLTIVNGVITDVH